MSVHEFAHAFVAYKLGDSTAKYSGRLTLNPLSHIDPFWTVLLPLFLFISSNGHFVFGAAKPVPINYWALGNPRRDIIWVGASGPIANFIFAIFISLLLHMFPLNPLINSLLIQLAIINVVLGVFNLIPIPPLDGSRILTGILPRNLSALYLTIEPFGFIILMVLLWSGVFNNLIWNSVRFFLNLLGI
ncbi:MAG: site-2 protease family protein [Candidatus Omnitrophica bacterium]|nr:site-2 protease family protein [Candidatus Omnitrophota bacterium]